MFTGIITHIGKVQSILKQGDWIFTIHVPGFAQDAAIGASISHGGACLTIIRKSPDGYNVQVSAETLSKTTLGSWSEGTKVNLERALKVGDELGGHLVTGHVDGLARLVSHQPAGESWKLTFESPVELSRFIAAKGSVTLDGVSLTVNEAKGHSFSVNIIPHTLGATTLGQLKAGDSVNLEIDIIARYLARQNEV